MPIVLNGSTGAVTGLAALPDSAMASGSIIQVVSTTKTDTFSTSGTSYADITGLSVTITPSSSSNKILILTHVTGNGNTNTRCSFRMVRDSTAIGVGDAYGNRTRTFGGIYDSGNDNTTNTVSAVYLDSPATTSATTYKVQTSQLTGQTVYVNRSDSWTDDQTHNTGTSSITVMEVAA
jgi:hypothetical protein